MAGQFRLLQNSRWIVGMGLVGIGLFILWANLADTMAQWSQLVGISADAMEAVGELTAVGLAATQVWRAYVFDRRELLLGVCGILVSFWPLMLVAAGAVLTGMASESV